MSADLTGGLLKSSIEVPCPRCSYPVLVAEVVAQTTVRCPCCRIGIRMVDAGGGVQNLGGMIESRMRRALEGRRG